MKVRFNRQEMSDAFVSICGVAASRTPKEVLKCVRIEAHGDFVLLLATDLEVGIRCAVNQVEVTETGEVLVLADMLAQIVRESTDDLLSLELEGNNLHVRGDDSHFQVVTQDVSEFPPVAMMDGDPDFVITFGLIRRLTEWTLFAAARESTRYAIHGVFWEVAGEKLTMATTDGRRLSCGHGPIAVGGKEANWQAIVPVKALALISRATADPEAQVGVKMTASQLLLHVGPTTISTSLVEGRFPKYQDVIPTDCDKLVELNTLAFQSALKRAALLTNEESKGVRLSFAKDVLTLSSRAPEQGEATISLPVVYDHDPVEIGFNPTFLLDVLRVAHTDTISLAIKEANRPGVVRISDDLVYVVMPVNLS